jgi:hypothetical protein
MQIENQKISKTMLMNLAISLIVLIIAGCTLASRTYATMIEPKEGNFVLQKWKKAVIHLECATDSEHFDDRIKKIQQLQKRLQSGEIDHKRFYEEILGHRRDIRFQGTALFITHDGRRYLVTARHVVFDELSAKREVQEEDKRSLSWPEKMRPSLRQSARERALQRIFNSIFRVPSLDEILSTPPQSNREFLMNLGAGGTSAYTFSPPELDLAVISLDQRDSKFADQLTKLGYQPIESDVIDQKPPIEGRELFTVGYPSSIALIGQLNLDTASAQWSSNYFSLPVFAFGKVSMVHDKLPFFWADMSTYPGNSGGPVIQDEKLVGIVSKQATTPIDDVPTLRTRIPFGRVIQSKYVLELLLMQAHKDMEWKKMHNKANSADAKKSAAD